MGLVVVSVACSGRGWRWREQVLQPHDWPLSGRDVGALGLMEDLLQFTPIPQPPTYSRGKKSSH